VIQLRPFSSYAVLEIVEISHACFVHLLLQCANMEATVKAEQILAFLLLLAARGQSNLTKSASWGAHFPVRGHPRGSKVVPLNSWGRVSY